MDAIFEIEAYDTFQMAIKDIMLIKNHTSSQFLNTQIAPADIEAAKEDLRMLLIKTNFDINEVSKQILSRNWDQDRAKQFVSLLEETKTDLFRSVITHYNSAYGDTVEDFIWLLKLVLGTSESKIIRYSILQLVLSTVNSNGQSKQKLFELNKDALSTLIQNLESYLNVDTL